MKAENEDKEEIIAFIDTLNGKNCKAYTCATLCQDVFQRSTFLSDSLTLLSAPLESALFAFFGYSSAQLGEIDNKSSCPNSQQHVTVVVAVIGKI